MNRYSSLIPDRAFSGCCGGQHQLNFASRSRSTLLSLAFRLPNRARLSPAAGWEQRMPHSTPVFRSPKRSEERRVGKECRSRWWPYNLEKKQKANADCRGLMQTSKRVTADIGGL